MIYFPDWHLEIQSQDHNDFCIADHHAAAEGKNSEPPAFHGVVSQDEGEAYAKANLKPDELFSCVDLFVHFLVRTPHTLFLRRNSKRLDPMLFHIARLH